MGGFLGLIKLTRRFILVLGYVYLYDFFYGDFLFYKMNDLWLKGNGYFEYKF